MTDDELLENFYKKIKSKIKELNETLSGKCYVCEEEISEWIVIIPENFDEDIGLGKAVGDKTRIAFIPVCYKHDIDDNEIIKKIREMVIIKSQALRN